MTFSIKKSLLRGADLDAAVAAHVDELRRWGEHMDRADADPKTHQAYPAPDAPRIVAACVRSDVEGGKRTFVPDYRIENDDPTAEQVLAAKKNDLSHKLALAEAEALERAMPRRRRRLIEMAAEDAAEIPEKKRTPEHLRAIAAHVDAQRRIRAVHRAAATAEAAIEDLTEKTVDRWTPPKFEE